MRLLAIVLAVTAASTLVSITETVYDQIGDSSALWDINDAGVAVGNSRGSYNRVQAVIVDEAGAHALPPAHPDETQSVARSVDEAGNVVGISYWDDSSLRQRQRAAYWAADGTAALLPQAIAPPLNPHSMAHTVSPTTKIIGGWAYTQTADGSGRAGAVIWPSPTSAPVAREMPGEGASEVKFVNDDGAALGHVYLYKDNPEYPGMNRRVVYWDPFGTPTEVPTPIPDAYSHFAFALALTNTHQVLGYYHDGSGDHAFIWSPGDVSLTPVNAPGLVRDMAEDGSLLTAAEIQIDGNWHVLSPTAHTDAFARNNAGGAAGQRYSSSRWHAATWQATVLNDTDGDGVADDDDNCPTVANADQVDSNGDGAGDACSNTAPTLALGGPYSAEEGSELSLALFGSDPDGDALTYSWDLGDGTTGSGSTIPQSHTYADNGSYTILVTVDDGNGGTAQASAEVTITNVAPSVGAISAPTAPVAVGTAVTASAPYTDPGPLDTHTTEIEWNAYGTSILTVETAASGTTSGSYTYADPGVHAVKIEVTDDDGDTGQSVFEYVVVYDPDGGFVTGGGRIDSPEDACLWSGCAPDGSTVGQATFGFVSKYKKGAATPSGNTEFRFKAGDLNFTSSSYEWLVISGPKAQYKGSGQINGTGDYGFMLTANDGEVNGGGGVDRFRIKIWDEATDQVVYDNQRGDSDDVDLSTAITRGSIVIHKK